MHTHGLPFELNIFEQVFKNQPVKNAYVFGSYASGNYSQESDIDILVETEPGMDLFRFVAIKNQLEQLLRKPVDLVSAQGISERLLPYIHQNKLQVYEKQNC